MYNLRKYTGVLLYMNTYNKYVEAVLAMGFSHSVPVEGLELHCEPEIRDYCDPAQCTRVCPPGCGSLEECQERAGAYSFGIVLQTVSTIPLLIGKHTKLHRVQKEHNSRLLRLADMVRGMA